MSQNARAQKVSIDPPSNARLIGRDKKCREHRYEPEANRMWVSIRRQDNCWSVGPVQDLEQYVDDMDELVGWEDLRYRTDDPWAALAERTLEALDDD